MPFYWASLLLRLSQQDQYWLIQPLFAANSLLISQSTWLFMMCHTSSFCSSKYKLWSKEHSHMLPLSKISTISDNNIPENKSISILFPKLMMEATSLLSPMKLKRKTEWLIPSTSLLKRKRILNTIVSNFPSFYYALFFYGQFLYYYYPPTCAESNFPCLKIHSNKTSWYISQKSHSFLHHLWIHLYWNARHLCCWNLPLFAFCHALGLFLWRRK